MRLLIYGMQSSGASTLAMLLAQRPDCAAFLDIWTMYVAPQLPKGADVVAKVVVTTAYSLKLHKKRFRPDCTVLFLRHPIANYRSLSTKSYRHHCGFLEEKFAVLDRVFESRADFDAVLYYEDLIYDTEATLRAVAGLGWACSPQPCFARSPEAIRAFNELHYPSIVDRLEYGPGNFHWDSLNPDLVNLPREARAASVVNAYCPRLTAHYADILERGGRKNWPVRR